MTQKEWDDLPGIVVHLTTNDGRYYLCSSQLVPIEPAPLYEAAPGRAYPDLQAERSTVICKQCQACMSIELWCLAQR